jgi:hypothetical protein
MKRKLIQLAFLRLCTKALLNAGLICSLAGASAQIYAREEHRRHVIVCVDGVGLSLLKRMRAEGRFKMFREPSHMIAPFPTLTNLAMTDILAPAGAREPAGYEDTFFDVTGNRMRGGLLDRLRGDRFVRGTFRELFDYHPSAVKSGLGYAAPPLSTYLEALSDLARLRQKARSARGPVFIGYTGATDSLAHLGGERLLRAFLRELDEDLSALVKESREPVAVTVFSDHGNHFRKYRRVNLKKPLRAAGFRFSKRVTDARSVVFPQFGLIGCAVLFTQEENEERVAQAAAEGVDFAAYERAGTVHVVGRAGRATVERRGERFRYAAAAGDPLGLAGALAALKAQGRLDAEGFAADSDWFALTSGGARPDAVRRVYEGVTGGVANRASVIVSFEDGYYSGSSALDLFAVLRATHGNLGREQSYGFVMSTHLELPAYVRAEDLWPALGHPRLRKAGKGDF